jgi:hypothetical protein
MGHHFWDNSPSFSFSFGIVVVVRIESGGPFFILKFVPSNWELHSSGLFFVQN